MFKSIVSGAVLACVSTFAFASDMPTKLPAPAAPKGMFSWEGPYAGLNAGGGLTSTTFDDHNGWFSFGSLYDGWGGSAGLTAGYNFQSGRMVYGIESDINLASLTSQYSDPDWPAYLQNEMPWYSTLRGRVGLAIDNVLLYGTAGIAFMKLKNSACYSDPCDFSSEFDGEYSSNQLGFAVGGGLEFAFSQNMSFKSEYLALIGTESTSLYNGWRSSLDAGTWQTTVHQIRVGVNYHF